MVLIYVGSTRGRSFTRSGARSVSRQRSEPPRHLCQAGARTTVPLAWGWQLPLDGASLTPAGPSPLPAASLRPSRANPRYFFRRTPPGCPTSLLWDGKLRASGTRKSEDRVELPEIKGP
ncbi:hypothetical protein NDU88_007276 [Pleurodeles waltl]|uniref:Uncharacterized protein n=1 Tax=Pleurodeles waltl TaxID=8319 RepID=A0AAV7QKF1_PLEWA|nr:hypothetical protein NDU88_007276 [Pleurodeles waltl]